MAEPPLPPAQWRTLIAVCETLVGGAAPGDAAGAGSLDLDVPGRLARAVATTGNPRDLRDLGLLLRLLESPLGRLLTGGRWGRFSRLPPAARADVLRRWAHSAFPLLRQGFQVLKRLTGFFYGAGVDDQGHNPNWPRVGYAVPAPDTGPGAVAAPGTAPPARNGLRPLSPAGDLVLSADVVVVGSGAGGAVAAAVLAARGREVLVLEQGAWLTEPDFTGREIDAMERLYLERGMLATRDGGIALLAGSCVGGGTVVNWAACLPPPPELLAEWEQEHGLTGVTGPEFAAAVATVSARLGVAEPAAPIPAGSSAGRLLSGCGALGYHTAVMPQNLRGCGGEECGWCCFGCRRGTKQSALRTFLPDAADQGARLLAGCTVDRVEIRGGQVRGVTGRVQSGGRTHTVTVRAPRVVLAAGALRTPAVLLRSGLNHPHIGRHLHLHPTTAVVGYYPEPVEAWKGPLLPAYCDQFGRLPGGHGFMLETAPAHPGLAGMAMPWQGAGQYQRDLVALRNGGVIIVLTRDRGSGRVTVDRAGRARVDYRVSAVDAPLLRRGIWEAARVHAAAGATEVLTLHSRVTRGRPGGPEWAAFGQELTQGPTGPNQLMVFSAHQMSTCRLGNSPRRAVADPAGRVWGVKGLYIADASAFPSASGINPMLTIMALSHWIAQGMD